MLLGIPFHASLIYREVEWTISAPQSSETLQFLAGISNSFRMPAFFIVAGFFAYLTLTKTSPNSWLKSRTIKIGTPYIFATLTLIPLQIFISDGAEGLKQFGRHWIDYLWFLVNIIFYNTLLTIIYKRRESPLVNEITTKITQITPSPTNVLLATICITTYIVAIAGSMKIISIIPNTDMLVWLLRNILNYAPFFCFGILLAARPILLQKFTRPNPTCTIIAILSSLLYAATWMNNPIIKSIAFPICGFFASQCIFALAYKHFNYSNKLIQELSKGAFSIYLLHHPIIVIAGTAIITTTLPTAIQFFLITMAATITSFFIYKITWKNKTTRFLLNGISPGIIKNTNQESPLQT